VRRTRESAKQGKLFDIATLAFNAGAATLRDVVTFYFAQRGPIMKSNGFLRLRKFSAG